jgi:hypothetical protein
VVFLIVCMFLVIVLCYARPFEVSMGAVITLTGLPAFLVGVVWQNKPLWFQNMFCKYFYCNCNLLVTSFPLYMQHNLFPAVFLYCFLVSNYAQMMKEEKIKSNAYPYKMLLHSDPNNCLSVVHVWC